MTGVAVVGSGIAGIACARALAARGAKVTILDGGDTLEPERQAVVDGLRDQDPADWDHSDIEKIKENHTVLTERIPRKLAFGSSYIYGSDRDHSPIDAGDTVAVPSFGRGGFSNVWGGTVLPYRDCDIKAWPIAFSDLKPYYEKVLATLPISARADRLERQFPILKSNFGQLDTDPQIQQLLNDLEAAGGRLDEREVLFGIARLAVHVEASAASPGCSYCGLCLTGCPREAIHTTSHELRELAAGANVRYRPGIIVRKVEESPDGVEVTYLKSGDRVLRTEQYRQVFIGAGAINTSRIMMQSLGIFGQKLILKDSQKFHIPLLRYRSVPRSGLRPTNTLAGIFVEFKLRQISDHWVHVQVSPNNEMVRRKFGLVGGGARPFLARLLAPLMDRLMHCWGAVHSDHSASLALTLQPGGMQDNQVLELRSETNAETASIIRQVVHELRGHRALFKALPIPPTTPAAPGGGNHYGGSFPMYRQPKEKWQTDLLGRPAGQRRVFLIDSTTFPSIPATTIALTVMANASRIGSLADLG
jgi:ferredoxin